MNTNRGAHSRDGLIGGIVLVLIGTLFLVQELFSIDVWHYAWPLVLIAMGVGMFVRRRPSSADLEP